jgi:hypothetical protein
MASRCSTSMQIQRGINMKTFIAVMATLFVVGAAYADKVCNNVYNPHSGKWEYQCVDRDDNDRRAPVCRQQYDPMNQVWVTVCD